MQIRLEQHHTPGFQLDFSGSKRKRNELVLMPTSLCLLSIIVGLGFRPLNFSYSLRLSGHHDSNLPPGLTPEYLWFMYLQRYLQGLQRFLMLLGTHSQSNLLCKIQTPFLLITSQWHPSKEKDKELT